MDDQMTREDSCEDAAADAVVLLRLILFLGRARTVLCFLVYSPVTGVTTSSFSPRQPTEIALLPFEIDDPFRTTGPTS